MKFRKEPERRNAAAFLKVPRISYEDSINVRR
jgi:hypothetical protein